MGWWRLTHSEATLSDLNVASVETVESVNPSETFVLSYFITMSKEDDGLRGLKFCLVRFIDDGLVKIARSDIVRYAESKSPFCPKSSEDLPTDAIEVRWQKSMCGKDFSGYFLADVLAIGSKYESSSMS